MKMFTRSILLSTALSVGVASAADIKPAIAEFNALSMTKAKPMFQALQNDDQYKNLANIYLGRIELAAGHLDEARKYFDVSLSIEPNTAEEHYWLAATCGTILTLPGKSQDMDAFFCYGQNLDAANALDPKHVPTLLLFFQINLQASAVGGGSREKASELLAQLERVSKADAAAARLFAFNFDKEAEKAVALAHSMIADFPQSEKALMEAGRVLSKNGEYDLARTAFEKAAAIKPTVDNRSSIQIALSELGLIALLTKSNIDGGIAALNRAVDTSAFPVTGYTNWAYWRLAQLYKLKGDVNQQKKALELLDKTGFEKATLLKREMQ